MKYQILFSEKKKCIIKLLSVEVALSVVEVKIESISSSDTDLE